MAPDPVVVEVVREMFRKADALDARAAKLPRWRWKRRRLRESAKITRQAAGMVWADHNSPARPIVVVMRRRMFF